ncbi:hypothetical protein [Aquimarina longa]|uniref:hypothetical protein n=1 Tax=Aquimarina longa TaxID=1080221 RepID=UPI000781CEED|nr:hypothetical protein [Aquimarina longa]
MDLEYVLKNEGKQTVFIGKFEHQKEKKPFSTYKIILKDKTKIILSLKDDEDTEKVLIKHNGNKYIKVIGRVFVNEIPEEYAIISRTNSPYLVDIKSIQLFL